MKTEVKDVESYKKKLNVEVPAEEVSPYLDKAYLKYQRKIKIDGFRQGKAPLSLIKKRFGKSIEADVADDLVKEFYSKALDENNISPVAPGQIISVNYQEGEPLKFTAEVEVEPEITVKDYKGVKVEKEIIPVTDHDIEMMIQYLLEQHAERKEVKEGAEKGFLLEADIQALDPTGFPIVGQKWEKRIIELGLSPFAGDVEEQLLGIKAGEERRMHIHLPGETQDNNMNTEQHYLLHVHQIFEKIVPVFDDDFAKKLGEYENTDQLKSRLKENLESQRERDSENTMRQKLMQEIVKRNDYTLPPAQIEHTLNKMYEDEQKRSEKPVNKDQFLQQNQPMLVWSIKWDRISHKIAENESIVVTDEAIDTEINKIVETNPEQEKRIRAQYKSEQARERIREHLLEEELMQFLKSEAKIKEVTVKPDKKKKSSIIT